MSALFGDRAPGSLDKLARSQQGSHANSILGGISMKAIASGLLVLGLLAVQVSEANAVVCAAGRYHAGCAGPRGAVVGHRPVYGRPVYGRPVYAAPHCYWRAGVRICR
jgi:hypothetical protein